MDSCEINKFRFVFLYQNTVWRYSNAINNEIMEKYDIKTAIKTSPLALIDSFKREFMNKDNMEFEVQLQKR